MEFEEELGLLKEQLKFDDSFEVPNGTKNIVIAGMGGSGISGKIFHELYTKKPVHLVDDYRVPDFVSGSTLFISISYSGNTEETVSATKAAIEKGASTVTITAGGKLAEYGDQRIEIPRRDLQPRSATGYMLMPLLHGFDMVDDEEISDSYRLLSGLDRDSKDCLAHARNIYRNNSIPVIYGSHPYKSVAYRWKTQFNENAKILGYSNSFPELNHNDTMAIAQTYMKDKFYFMVFASELERIRERIEVTSRITESQFKLIHPKGKSDISRIFYLIHYGDYVTYHLGRLRKVNPTDVSLIEKLKKALG